MISNTVYVAPSKKRLAFIGDVHGCFDELSTLLEKVGFSIGEDFSLEHSENLVPVFLGDITDRGPRNRDCLRLVVTNWKQGRCLWTMGNHDNKLFRWMKGNDVRAAYGLEKTIAELEEDWPFKESREALGHFLLQNVPTRLVFKEHGVVAVHAQNSEDGNDHVYGQRGEDGRRLSWWETHQGPEFVVFGHYWLDDPEPREYWCCVDTSCVRGGRMTALLWPEKRVVSVNSNEDYDL